MTPAERAALDFLLAFAGATVRRMSKLCVTLEIGGRELRVSELDSEIRTLRERLAAEDVAEATRCLR